MSVRLENFSNSGDLEKERIVMKVSANGDIGAYAVFRSLKRENEITTTITDQFWFPDREIKKGDRIVLYSKSGDHSTKTNDDGTSSHFFYWDKTTPLWAESTYSAVLLHVDRWHSINPSD